jgi:hypothetical protein
MGYIYIYSFKLDMFLLNFFYRHIYYDVNNLFKLNKKNTSMNYRQNGTRYIVRIYFFSMGIFELEYLRRKS